ncbi:MAG: hypothetical protein JF887_08520 [Candidatus Dormibacteraeota bacterium]|uniref:Uncharacterized protein n=1 Tax=Candidatus Amunia macphersoniae TaxID=3127014 RepID=A0A934NF49_9BACT|nr:hypothetical protein [Candidatus Dormibacteraeota bacterium]
MTDHDPWAAVGDDPFAQQPRRESVRWGEGTLRVGDRVRLAPRGNADALDMFLRGRTATIESIEQDYEDVVYLAVTIDDDPGADLGMLRQPGHRFFFTLNDVEAVAGWETSAAPAGETP